MSRRKHARLLCSRVWDLPEPWVKSFVEPCVLCKQSCWVSERVRAKWKKLQLRVTCWPCVLDRDEGVVEIGMLDEVLAEVSELEGREITREEGIDIVLRGMKREVAQRIREKMMKG